MVPRALPRLRIASPCTVDWNTMVGGDRARHCGQCGQTVYNVAKLRPREVADLLERHGDRMPCLRLYTRPDGTVVTRSCLHLLAAGVRRVRMGFAAIAALAVTFWSNVLVWRQVLHRAPAPPATVKVAPARPFPPLEYPLFRDTAVLTAGAGEPPRSPERQLLPDLRRGGPVATETMIRDALQPLTAQLESRGDGLGLGHVLVLLEVRPSGGVRRAYLDAPSDFPANFRRWILIKARSARLPRNSEAYDVSFPLRFR